MPASANELWKRFQQYFCTIDSVGLSLDISRMSFDEQFLKRMEPQIQRAYSAMDDLEKGAIANPDEQRMVGHYWLRAPKLAPTASITAEIEQTLAAIKSFAADVHSGKIKPAIAPRFTQLLSIGIGGSALGPMFVADALGRGPDDQMKPHFIDNTDPDGMDRVLKNLGPRLKETLCLVISKSGTTPEPRNGMLVVADACRMAGLEFARQAVAITGEGSELDNLADSQHWLARFPMWDWVGGRTSETGPVGLVPAALQGIDIDSLLAGAAACDAATRTHEALKNPSALLALMWFHATDGRGMKDMIMLPYKDRLLLLSRYLQQLVMESLGKRMDLSGKRVDQGIAVYGNKGSTDQHAYVQQLRDGVNNFFVTFIRVLEDGGAAVNIEAETTPGDYLNGFLLGTRAALFENERQSITVTVKRVDARTVGALIALFERAVGFYGSLVNINAYNQPGVEAGKKAAANVLQVQRKILEKLTSSAQSAEQIAASIGMPDEAEAAYHLLEHLCANGKATVAAAARPGQVTFTRK
jgi:glucose-6-phosphate isomerase